MVVLIDKYSSYNISLLDWAHTYNALSSFTIGLFYLTHISFLYKLHFDIRIIEICLRIYTRVACQSTRF